MTDTIELKAIAEPMKEYDALEARLKRFFVEYLYKPLLKELDLPVKKTLTNAHPNPLMDALFSGKIVYTGGAFRGKFNAGISKELRAIGAKFDRKTSSYQLPFAEIPVDVKQVISSTEIFFQKKLADLDQKLARVVPAELADQFKCADIFDKTLWKADREFRKNVKNIAVVPELTKEERERISVGWQNNMKLYIKDWTEKQIKDLRANIYDQIVSGARRDQLIPPIMKITQTIQGSHTQALNKAKFLARQESRLLMAAFKQTRYEAAGSTSYIWRNVHRPKDRSPEQHTPGNVRYAHALLDGKEFQWSNPPVTTNPGQTARRNNPGQDYNCRCFSRPLIRKRNG